MLDYKLLIICICIVVALNLYLFFWNRFVGLVLSFILRLLFHNRGESSFWVDIGTSAQTQFVTMMYSQLVRFYSCLLTRRTHTVQGFTLSFQQSKYQGCEGAAQLEILDSVSGWRGRSQPCTRNGRGYRL